MSRSRSMTALFAVLFSVFFLVGCGGTEPASSAPAGYNNFSAAPKSVARDLPSGPLAGPKSPAATDPAPPASAPRGPIPAQHAPLPPSVSASGQFRSATLTAGSLDDQGKFDEFSAYLSKAMQHDRRQELPRFSVGGRAVVRVVNEQGQPIGDARVTIRAADSLALAAAGQGFPLSNSAALLDMTTGADGQVVFLSGLDAPAGRSEFVLTATPAAGGQPVTQRVSLDQTPWQVTLAQARQELPRQLDLALVIDTTGSMQDELDYLKVEIDHIAAEVHERFPNVDQRFSLILYRDQGDEYVTRAFDFTPSLADFRRTLAAQAASGGGDEPEAMHLGLELCTQLSWRGSGTARVAFLVADAPPHAQFAQRTLDAAQKLRRAGVTVFPVASSGVKERAEFIMRAIGFVTQGQYLFLTDHSGVGNPHAKPQAPNYSVEKLDQLMIRMITAKLSGQGGLPQDVIAVEESDQVSGVSPAVNSTSPENVIPVQQPTLSTTPALPRPMRCEPPSRPSQPKVLAEIFAALTEFDWWSLGQMLLFIGAAMLLIVVEHALGA